MNDLLKRVRESCRLWRRSGMKWTFHDHVSLFAPVPTPELEEAMTLAFELGRQRLARDVGDLLLLRELQAMDDELQAQIASDSPLAFEVYESPEIDDDIVIVE